MKKTKIMLTAIAVVAVVGGALAFKAKKTPNFTLCTSSVRGVCATPEFPNNTATLVNTTIFYYTIKPAGQVIPCSQLNCTFPGDVVID